MKTSEFKFSERDKQRFWALIDIKGAEECWKWKGQIKSDNTPRWSVRVARCVFHFAAVRLAYAFDRGKVDDDKAIVHTCHNTICCNPAHITFRVKKRKRYINPTCESCNKPNNGNYGSGRFCSQPCARGFSTSQNREERNKKITESLFSYHGKNELMLMNECIICHSKFEVSRGNRTERIKCCSPRCLSTSRARCLGEWAGIWAQTPSWIRVPRLEYSSPIAGDISVQGKWELSFCEWADKHKLQWAKNTQPFEYYREDKDRTANYYPDFIIEDDLFIEVKGFEGGLDPIKWEQFPSRLIVLREEEIMMIRKGHNPDEVFAIADKIGFAE